MRGRPAPPEDVLRMKCVYDVDINLNTCAWWLHVPGAQSLSVSQLEAIAAEFLVWWMPLTADITHRGCHFTRVDVNRYGTSPLALSRRVLPVHGRWTGGQVLVACTTLHLLSGEGGRGHDSIVHVPGFPDAFTQDHATLNDLAWATASDAAFTFLNGVAGIPSPAGGFCQLATVHFSERGAPLAMSTWNPGIGLVPGWRIGTLDRRRLV